MTCSSGDFKMRVEPIPGSEAVSRKGAVRFDLPRDPNNNAIFGDSRNDEHVILAQLHVGSPAFSQRGGRPLAQGSLSCRSIG